MAAPQNTGGPPVFERIAIVGCGLIGGSIGLAARRRWPGALVVGVDRNAVIERAIARHAIEVGGEDLGLAGEADLVVLAAPVARNIEVLGRLADVVRRPAIVTDVGGTKQTTGAAGRQLPETLRFIGGHPLAGAAQGGIERARPDLFDGRPWILTTDAADAGAARLEAFLEGLGARPRRMAAEAHDAALAYLSHLPQLTASALMHVVGTHASGDLDLAGRGLRDTTRLAASPSDIWRDVVSSNRAHVTAALDELIAVLRRLRDDEDGQALAEVFGSAAAWKRALEDDPAG